ncbi:MAG TPA: amino acid ABC transporter substrate-binding protein [Methylomirabilota bacterium]|nr:amino acid ABC transporter substrate-binding protein [Methylomirabilota bacterium]
MTTVRALVFGAVLLSTLSLAAQGPIRIGASLSLTGTYAKPGNYQHESYKLCAKHLNDKRGLLGRTVEFVVYDDQSTPAAAVRLYEKLLTEDKVDVVIGPYSSSITEAVANVTEKHKKVMVAPLADTPSIFKRPSGRKRNYVVMVLSPAEVYLEGLVDLAGKRGLKSVAIVSEDTPFARASAQGVAEQSKRRGMQVVFQEGYPRGKGDFAALLTKLKPLNPDVLAAATNFDDAIAITRQIRDLNVNPKMYGVTVGGELSEFYDALQQNAEYIYGATQWEPTLPYPGQKAFVDAYRREFGREPVYHAAAGYAGCQIYAEAVRRAGSLNADRVREQLLRMELRTVFGDFKVDQDGFQVSHRMVLFQWQDGRKVSVWPEDVTSAKPRYPTPAWDQR